MLFVLTGLGNLGWGTAGNGWFFVGSLLVLGAALGITRYYDDHYGRATLSRSQQVRYSAVRTLIVCAAMIGGSVLDFSFHLPVSLFAISFGTGMLAGSPSAWG